jgi:hypothetical protein
MTGFPSLWLKNVMWCIYVPYFLYPSVDGHSGWWHNLAIVNNATINMGYRCLVNIGISFPLDICQVVGLLDRMEVLVLICFPYGCVFHHPTNRVQGILFLYNLTHTFNVYGTNSNNHSFVLDVEFFFLVSLDRCLPILLLFIKNQHFVPLIFLYYFQFHWSML